MRFKEGLEKDGDLIGPPGSHPASSASGAASLVRPSMVFTNVINPRSAVARKNEYKTTLVKKGATIGANSTIVCGNTIGRFAFIGAGAVVTKDVPDYALVVGNPARQTGWMSEYGHKLKFDEKGFAVCPESKSQYKLDNNKVSKVS